jgi:hypothetical protein
MKKVPAARDFFYVPALGINIINLILFNHKSPYLQGIYIFCLSLCYGRRQIYHDCR